MDNFKVQPNRTKEQIQLLTCIVNQNEELLQINESISTELKAINVRQNKENKFNFPFVLSSFLFGSSGVYIAVYGVAEYKVLLNSIFDFTFGLFV